jgi:hypothetical protein
MLTSSGRKTGVETRREELFSANVAAGSRMYFFDVKESVNGDRYLTISESRKDGEGGFEHNRVMVYEEHIEQFLTGAKQAIQFMTGGKKAYSVERIRRQHPKAYARWTEEEDRSLRGAWEQGKAIGELAEEFGRQPGAIRSRLRKLGLA